MVYEKGLLTKSVVLPYAPLAEMKNSNEHLTYINYILNEKQSVYIQPCNKKHYYV